MCKEFKGITTILTMYDTDREIIIENIILKVYEYYYIMIEHSASRKWHMKGQ